VESDTAVNLNPDEIAAAARSCLTWILTGMKVEAEVGSSLRDGQIVLDVVDSEDSSIVIGRKGQTLEALQTIVSRITANLFPDMARSHLRILIDVGGYRERRRQNLVDMALRAAEEVLETGEPIDLSPMNSYERYLVHSALKDEPGVTTSSEGEGAMKQIVISLADATGE
jgi:spoIIIJ-associated protein